MTVHGELDWATAPTLAAYLSEVVAGEPERLTLDLADLAFMDCAGFRPIARARRMLPEGCPVVLKSPRPAVRKLLAATGLDKVGGLKIG